MTHPTEEMRTPPPRQRRRHPIARRIILISLALLVALVATFIFVYQRAADELDEHVSAEYAVTHYVAVIFRPTAISSMPYDSLLTLMSGFGLTIDYASCGPYEIFEPIVGSQEGYLSGPDHFLAFDTTILAPPDWEAQLRALPIVESIDTRLLCDGSPIDYREHSWSGWWRKVTNPLFSPLRDPTPIRLHASNSTLSYEHAVRLALEMGFRLADPAYEAAKNRGESPPWDTISQNDTFAAQRTLLVAHAWHAARLEESGGSDSRVQH